MNMIKPIIFKAELLGTMAQENVFDFPTDEKAWCFSVFKTAFVYIYVVTK